MLLQEVIKVAQGKPFKLPQMTQYLYTKVNPIPQEDFLFWFDSNKLCNLITVTALMSDKWELMIIPNNVLEFSKKKSSRKHE
jgi:hypothetical protein